MPTSKEIEREVEDQRANVETTLEALKRKMSVGQIVDEFGSYVGTEDASLALRNAGRQIRENPLALGLVGAGLAWLFIGGRTGTQDRRDNRSLDRSEHDDDAAPVMGGGRYGSAFGTPYESPDDDDDEPRSGVVGRAEQFAGDAARAVGDTVSDAQRSAARAVSGVTGSLRDIGASAQQRGSRIGEDIADHLPDRDAIMRRGRSSASAITDALDSKPFMVGAATMALGIAIGAALPGTRMEDRWLGDERDALRDAAQGQARDLARSASNAARAGLAAASKAAKEEGLAPGPDGKTLAAKVDTVIRSGVEKTRRTLEGEADAETG